MKAKRSLDTDVRTHTNQSEVRMILSRPTDERFHCLFDAFRLGFTFEETALLTSIAPFSWKRSKISLTLKSTLRPGAALPTFLPQKYGFSNAEIAKISGRPAGEIEQAAGLPSYKMVDTCAAEFPASTPYFYSTQEPVCEIVPSTSQKVLILSGPIRIGQGIEFDYCTVHAVQALRDEGVEVHIVNNNPETVSTDFDTSDRLFFEPMHSRTSQTSS